MPLAGWIDGARPVGVLVGGVVGWAFALAYASAINQAFDDRLDAEAKNPRLPRGRAVPLALVPLGLCLLVLGVLSVDGVLPGAICVVAATLYSAPPRLKRFPVVGTVWNLVIGVPGFFFAGRGPSLWPLVVLFALLLLVSQLLHEAVDRDDDARGAVRTVATQAGRGAALGAAACVVVAVPVLAWWFGVGLVAVAACAVFAVVWAPLLWAQRGRDDARALARLRLWYRWSAIGLGGMAFAVMRF